MKVLWNQTALPRFPARWNLQTSDQPQERAPIEWETRAKLKIISKSLLLPPANEICEGCFNTCLLVILFTRGSTWAGTPRQVPNSQVSPSAGTPPGQVHHPRPQCMLGYGQHPVSIPLECISRYAILLDLLMLVRCANWSVHILARVSLQMVLLCWHLI